MELQKNPWCGSGRVQEALLPAQSAAQDAMQRLAQIVSQQPDLQFPISSDNQLWYIITYVDEVRASVSALCALLACLGRRLQETDGGNCKCAKGAMMEGSKNLVPKLGIRVCPCIVSCPACTCRLFAL